MNAYAGASQGTIKTPPETPAATAPRHDQDALLQQQRNVLEQPRPHSGNFYITDRPIYRDGKPIDTKNDYNGVISGANGEKHRIGVSFPKSGNQTFLSGFAQPNRGKGFGANAAYKAAQRRGAVTYNGIQISGKPLQMLPGQAKVWLSEDNGQVEAQGYYLCADTGELNRVYAKDRSTEKMDALGGITVAWNPDLARERAEIGAVFEQAGLLEDSAAEGSKFYDAAVAALCDGDLLDDEIPF